MENKLKFSKKMRAIFVISFIAIYLLITYISLRGQYLQYSELGTQYVDTFITNMKCKYLIMAISFVVISIVVYLTNIGIKKGLKPFFEAEKKEMPKIPNKSITLIIAAIVSVILSNTLLEKILLCTSNVSFEKTDILFNMDISYFMFIKPLIEEIIMVFLKLVIAISIYITAYYVIIFNYYFDAVDKDMLLKSRLSKRLQKNAFVLALSVAILTVLNVQNVVLGKFLTLSNGTELTGAGFIEATIQVWGYIILAFIIVISVAISIKFFKKAQYKKILITMLSIPAYLVLLFIVMVGYDLIFVKPNEFDKERAYINTNIEFTKNAYNINADETNVEYSGTVNEADVYNNSDVINNITLISKDIVMKKLEDTQTETGHYTFRNVALAKYKINNEEQLVYVAPREIENSSISYNNKTYEYTHGIGQIVASATQVTEDGNIQYLQKDIEGKDNIYQINEPRIYYGMETNSTVVTNTKNKTEYDYTDNDGIEHIYNYEGNSGIQVGFIDRLILAMNNKDLKLALSNSVTDESKILINRNVIERARKALPNLLYDENPYTVVSNGNIYWVLDAYTTSDRYPYSTYTELIKDNYKFKINYIRNSVKIIINAYSGEMKFYITDRTDPIIMAYLKLYPKMFAEYNDEEIPEDIKEQLKYPEFLYNIQSDMLSVYHNVKEDVLYRNNDIWSFAKYGSTTTNSSKIVLAKTVSSKSKVATLQPYYAKIKAPDEEKSQIGLIQVYTPNQKSNIISCLIGTCDGLENKLKIYKYPADSNILGPTQLDNQIEQDETISKELSALNVTGSRITKEMKIIPINNSMLYVENIYQTMANEPNKPTTLKKVIVASGTKVAIGDTLTKAITNLLSQSAVNIQVETTEDVQGLVKEIIDANNNLTESNNRNDWEMMGKDIKELQGLIKALEKITNNKDTNTLNQNTDINN